MGRSAGDPNIESANASMEWVGVAAARRAAFEVLMEVGAGRGHSDELLHSARLRGLSGPDRNLATAMVMGVLRWQIALDARLRGLLARPDQRMADEVWVALRLGAFQLLHMDRIPAHAALSESVSLCKASGQEHAAGMVNAVLRRLTRETAPGTRLFETTGAFAERLGHPGWMVERWVKAYGRAASLMICEADQREAVRGGMFSTDEGLQSVDLGGDGQVGGVVGMGGMPDMDDGSRLVAELASVAMNRVTGTVWDCCAAPGGKTMVMARRMEGSAILASDVSATRMSFMERRLGELAASAGTGGRVRCQVADVANLAAEEGLFDLVLCDVPCSGTGTLARNPEIRHRLRVEEVARQAARQKVILAAALKRVAEGGRLVFSTCSLEVEECEEVLAAVAGGWQRVPMEGLMRTLEDRKVLREGLKWGSMVRGDHLRTLPGVHGCDGFYAVVLQR